MADPPSSRLTPLQRFVARWNGPLFIVLGLYWLNSIRFASGLLTMRWILGIAFLVIGVGTTIGYLRSRRRGADHPRR